MKHLAALFLFLISFSANGQTNNDLSLNMTLLGNWDDETLVPQSSLGLVYNSVWGWVGADGHEYAILGGRDAVYFFDLKNPAKPTLLQKFNGLGTTIWREFKSYKNRVYAVCDGCQEGLMIFDMSEAPDTIKRSYFSNALFTNSHTITCDTTSGRLYLNGTSVGYNGILVLDIATNPDQPTAIDTLDLTFAGGNGGGYVHDSYVRGDTVYASHGYGGLGIWDFKGDKVHGPKLLGSVATGGYNHSGWLTNDGLTFVYAEEIPAGQPLHIIGLDNLENQEVSVEKAFKFPLHAPKDNNAIYHNVYIKDNLVYVASYLDGLQVFDIKDRKDPRQVAWYDTYHADTIYKIGTPSGGMTGYAGCWGAYPWLPSGTILASDMQNGLFTLKFVPTPSRTNPDRLDVVISPNPFSDMINLDFGLKSIATGTFTVYNSTGSIVIQQDFDEANRACFNTVGLAKGIYYVKVQTTDGRIAQRKMVKP